MAPKLPSPASRRERTTGFVTTLALVASIVLTGLPASAASENCASTDALDTDKDRLSDCLETEMLGSALAVKDTDADNIDDTWDLLKQEPEQGSVGEIPIQVKLTEGRDVKGCDVDGSHWEWWDPYIGIATLSMGTLESVHRYVYFTKDGFTSRDHPHDEEVIDMSTVVANIEIPQDYSIMEPRIGPWPGLDLLVGIIDHDNFKDDQVRLSGSDGDLRMTLPITKAFDGGNIEKRAEGYGGKCAAQLQITIQSVINVQDFIAAGLATSHNLVTFELVQNEMARLGAATRAGAIGHGSADALADEAAAIATSRPDALARLARMMQDAPDVDDPDHPFQGAQDNKYYGSVLKTVDPTMLQFGAQTECLYSTWHKDDEICSTDRDPIGTGKLPPINVTADGLSGFLHDCGVTTAAAASSTQSSSVSHCDLVLGTLLGLPATALAAAQQALDECGLGANPTLGQTRAEATACSDVLDQVQELPAVVGAALQDVLESCGIRAATASTAADAGVAGCEALIDQIQGLPSVVLGMVADALQECGVVLASGSTRAEDTACQQLLATILQLAEELVPAAVGLVQGLMPSVLGLVPDCGTDLRSAEANAAIECPEVPEVPRDLVPTIVAAIVALIPDCGLQAGSLQATAAATDCPEMPEVSAPQVPGSLLQAIREIVTECGSGAASAQAAAAEVNCPIPQAPILPALEVLQLASLQDAVAVFVNGFACADCAQDAASVCQDINGQLGSPMQAGELLTMPASASAYHFVHVTARDATGALVDEATLRLAADGQEDVGYNDATWALPTLQACDVAGSIDLDVSLLRETAEGTYEVFRQANTLIDLPEPRTVDMPFSPGTNYILVLGDGGTEEWGVDGTSQTFWDVLNQYFGN